MKTLILLVVLIFAAGYSIGCRTEKGDEDRLIVEPTVTVWSLNSTFVVIKEVKRVDGLEMGRVILKRQDRSGLVSAIVVPYREIPVGTKVKLVKVTYSHDGAWQKDFLVVR